MLFILYFPECGRGFEVHQAIGAPLFVVGTFASAFGFLALGMGKIILPLAIASVISTAVSLVPLVWTLLYKKIRFAEQQTSDEAALSMLITGISGASLFAISSAVFFAVKFIIV